MDYMARMPLPISTARGKSCPFEASKFLATTFIGSIHSFLAGAIDAPELKLSDKEAHDYAKAVSIVEAMYPNNPYRKHQKIVAWLTLAQTLSGIYQPRVRDIVARKTAEAKAKKAPASAEIVTQYPPTGPFVHRAS